LSNNYNTAVGHEALNHNMSGNNNIAVGHQALPQNTSGDYNTANGAYTFINNTTGSYNTALGYYAYVTSGDLINATAIGANAVVSQDSSLVLGNAANVGIGTSSPAAKLHVVGRTRIDGDRLEFVNTGHSVFIGDGAGENDDFSNNQNVAVGDSALFSNTTGSYNTASGVGSLQSNTTGGHNTASGKSSLESNTGGYNNTASGYQSLRNNPGGGNNTASGSYSLRNNTTGGNNTASGKHSLYSNTTGADNTASGGSSLQSNTTGSANTANGFQSLYLNTGGYHNTASGSYSLWSNTTGYENTASGYQSLFSNTTGNYNTASGNGALRANTTGHRNTASGFEALNSNTTGYSNTASGYNALYFNSTGYSNVANGYNALAFNSTGNSNVAIGYEALADNGTGSFNTALGHYANVSTGNLTNATAIGANAVVSQDSSLVLGNAVNVGIGTSIPLVDFHIAGTTPISAVQDGVNSVVGMQAEGSSLKFGRLSGSDLTSLLYIKENGNVGIGTTTPGEKLEITGGNVAVDNGVTSRLKFANGSTLLSEIGQYNTTGMFIANKQDGDIRFHTGLSNDTKMIIESTGNIGINTSTPDNSAQLEVNSTTKGFLPPRLSTIEMLNIASPAEGLVVYNTTSKTLNVFDGTDWTDMTGNVQSPAIGDYYQGGVVFYLDGSGGGLICAVNDQNGGSGIQWYNGVNIITGAVGSAIGAGQWNTTTIINSQGTGDYAATICDDYTVGAYSDWFLPSKDELNEMYVKKSTIDATAITNGGSALSGAYWTSTESGSSGDVARLQNLDSGQHMGGGKMMQNKVRAVRAF